MTPEHKVKISLANKGRVMTPEQNKINSEAHCGQVSGMKGRCHSEESKRKMSAARIGRKLSDETKKKIGIALRGHKMPEHNRLNLIEANKGRVVSDETRAKMSESHRGKISPLRGIPRSDEVKRKMSLAMIGRVMSPEARRKMSESRMGHGVSDVTRMKIAEALDGRLPPITGKKHSAATKEKMRLSTLKRISKQFFNGEPMMPCVGFQERKFFDEISRLSCYPVKRQLQVCGYFLDGYIEEIGLAIEFDESKHRRQAIRRRDEVRQSEITAKLGCRFWRVSEQEWENDSQGVIGKFQEILRAA